MFVQCSSKEEKLPLGCSSTGSKLTAIKTIRVQKFSSVSFTRHSTPKPHFSWCLPLVSCRCSGQNLCSMHFISVQRIHPQKALSASRGDVFFSAPTLTLFKIILFELIFTRRKIHIFQLMPVLDLGIQVCSTHLQRWWLKFSVPFV